LDAIRGGQATSLAGSFLIKLMNEYDEVLQGEARVQVSVSIYYKPNPSLSQTVTYGADDLLNGWLVSSGVLTLGVDTAAVFLRQWSHHTSDGTPFWQFVDLTPRTTAKGEPYLESDPMHFVARASVQVFKNVQPLQTREIEFTLVYDVFQTTL
jgi:hypothetical protein